MISQFAENTYIGSPCTSKAMVFSNSSTLLMGSSNRVISYEMHRNVVEEVTQARFNVKLLAVSGTQLSTVDDQFNLITDGVHTSGKRRPIKCLSYSPDGKMLAIARQSKLQIYANGQKIKTHSNKHVIQGLSWSPDSRFVLTWGDDNTVILNAVFSLRLYTDVMLQTHKFKIATSYFYDSQRIISVDQLGKVILWRFVDDHLTEGFLKYQAHQKAKHSNKIHLETNQEPYSTEEMKFMSDFEKNIHNGRFILEKRQNIKDLIKDFARIKGICHKGNLLITGMKNGIMTIFRISIEDENLLNPIQSFQITQTAIDSIMINQNGNWIALGMKTTGQLIVWEWRSQSYILNQQALSYEVSCATISNDLTTIAAGTVGGLVRLYDYTSKFCIAKLEEGTAKITGIKFCPNKIGVLLTCSLDGVVRAFDSVRLKCFRKMTTEVPNQLQCLDVEPSGELIVAGGLDPYEIYVYSLRTGECVEVIAGHQGPVSQLKFTITPDAVLLVSGSWDKTIRVHDLYARGSKTGSGGEMMLHNSEITAIALFQSNAAVATMGGELLMWDLKEAQVLYSFDVLRDIQGGRQSREMVAAQKNQNLKHLTAIEFSRDGQFLLGGGNSKYMCLYDLKFRILIRKMIISNNMSLDGMKLKVNFSTIDEENRLIEESDDEDNNNNNLPGARSFDVSKRSNKRVPVGVNTIEFSQSNRAFVIAHSEGVSVFGPAKRKHLFFDPLLIDESITTEELQNLINKNQLPQGLLLALKLNQIQLTAQVLDAIPYTEIQQAVQLIPEIFAHRLIEVIIYSLENTRNIEKNLIWTKYILIEFADAIKQDLKFKNILQELLKYIKLDFQKITVPIRQCINQIEYCLIHA